MLAAVFFLSRKIKTREKVFNISILAFLIISVNVNVLNFIWHGFHSTNMIPYRYSFLISFILVIMAYRAFQLLEDMNTADLVAMAAVAVFVIACAAFGPQGTTAVAGSAVLAAIILLVFFLYQKRYSIKRRSPALYAASFWSRCVSTHILVWIPSASLRVPAIPTSMTPCKIPLRNQSTG